MEIYMKTSEVFEETGKIGNEIVKEHIKLDKLNNRCLEIMNLCPHEIVFKYNDNHPKKLKTDGNYFCPACGKTIKCIDHNQILESPFNNSRIISLSNLSLIGNKETYSSIRNEVYCNMNFYYNTDINDDVLSSKMETILKEMQVNYLPQSKVLKKVKN